MIQIPLTPDQFQSKAAKISAEQGISLTGREGTIDKMGVKANWVYEDETLKITIVDKPIFLSEEMVEERLKTFLQVPHTSSLEVLDRRSAVSCG